MRTIACLAITAILFLAGLGLLVLSNSGLLSFDAPYIVLGVGLLFWRLVAIRWKGPGVLE